MLWMLILISLFTPKPSPVEWLTPQEHDFGEISFKNPVTYAFEFKNITSDPLLIDNVRASCGCTSPNWTLEPIPADSTNQILIEFDAREVGYFRKRIKVYFNKIRKPEILYVEGDVVE